MNDSQSQPRNEVLNSSSASNGPATTKIMEGLSEGGGRKEGAKEGKKEGTTRHTLNRGVIPRKNLA